MNTSIIFIRRSLPSLMTKHLPSSWPLNIFISSTFYCCLVSSEWLLLCRSGDEKVIDFWNCMEDSRPSRHFHWTNCDRIEPLCSGWRIKIVSVRVRRIFGWSCYRFPNAKNNTNTVIIPLPRFCIAQTHDSSPVRDSETFHEWSDRASHCF